MTCFSIRWLLLIELSHGAYSSLRITVWCNPTSEGIYFQQYLLLFGVYQGIL